MVCVLQPAPGLHACAESVWVPTPFGFGALVSDFTALHEASRSTGAPSGSPSQKNWAVLNLQSL